MKKIIFLELFLRIIEDEKWNLFEKLGQLRTPSVCHCAAYCRRGSGHVRVSAEALLWLVEAVDCGGEAELCTKPRYVQIKQLHSHILLTQHIDESKCNFTNY